MFSYRKCLKVSNCTQMPRHSPRGAEIIHLEDLLQVPWSGAWPSCEQAALGFLFRGEQIHGLGGVHFMYGGTQKGHQRVEE